MLNTNYAKLAGGYPEYLRLPVELQSPLIINGVTHPAGAHLSTNDDTAIKELGYKPADPLLYDPADTPAIFSKLPAS